MRIMRLTRTRLSRSFVDSGRASLGQKENGHPLERPGARDATSRGGQRPAIGGDAGTRVHCGTEAGRLRVGESPPRFYEVGKLAAEG